MLDGGRSWINTRAPPYWGVSALCGPWGHSRTLLGTLDSTEVVVASSPEVLVVPLSQAANKPATRNDREDAPSTTNQRLDFTTPPFSSTVYTLIHDKR